MRILISLLFVILALVLIQPANSQNNNYKRDLRRGDLVYNLPAEAYAKVVNVVDADHITIKYITGKYAGQTGEGWDRISLALQEGCAADICVDDKVFHLQQDADSDVVAIAMDGTYVIKYTKGRYAGLTGSKWEYADLGRLKGCDDVQKICVGDQVQLKKTQDYAVIYGLQADSNFILKFQTGRYMGATGHGWGRNDFEIVAPAKAPKMAENSKPGQKTATETKSGQTASTDGKPAIKDVPAAEKKPIFGGPTANGPSGDFRSIEDLPN